MTVQLFLKNSVKSFHVTNKNCSIGKFFPWDEFSHAEPREKSQCWWKNFDKSYDFTNFLVRIHAYYCCKTMISWKIIYYYLKLCYLVYLNEMHFRNLLSGRIGFCNLQAGYFIPRDKLHSSGRKNSSLGPSALGMNFFNLQNVIHPLGWNTAFRVQHPILPSSRLRNSPFINVRRSQVRTFNLSEYLLRSYLHKIICPITANK